MRILLLQSCIPRVSSQSVEVVASTPEISHYYRISVSRDNMPSTFQYYESYKLRLRDGRMKKNLREVIEPNRASVNRVTFAFSPLVSFHRHSLCVCIHDTNVAAHVYRACKLQRTFAACTGARAYIGMVAKAKIAVCTWLVYLSRQVSVKVRIFLTQSTVVSRKFTNLQFFYVIR